MTTKLLLGVVGWVLKMKLMLTQLSAKLELMLKLKLSLAIWKIISVSYI